jgi:hypothetical protein
MMAGSFRRLGCLTIALLVLAASALAVDLDSYRTAIASAREDLAVLRESDREEQMAAAARIRKTLPVSQRVDVQGSTIEVSNQWLHDALDAAASESDPVKRDQLLGALDERLAAIEERAAELETAEPVSRAKDEDKRKLGEILSRTEYEPPKPPEESAVQRWIRQFLEWLQSIFPRAPASTPNLSGSPSLAKVLLALLGIIAAAALIFVLYKLRPSLFGRIRGRGDRSDRVILGEEISSDDSAADIFREAEELAREGDLRGAIRKGYIAYICYLSDLRVIEPARHKTNRDYLADARPRQELYQRLRGLTDIFERHWYGLRPPTIPDWEVFRRDYSAAIEGGEQN